MGSISERKDNHIMRFLAASVLAAPLALALGAPALACGGFFCMNQPMDQSGERIIFVQDRGQVTAHVQVNYQGDAKQFSWVVPTPTKPTLRPGTLSLHELEGTPMLDPRAERDALLNRFHVPLSKAVVAQSLAVEFLASRVAPSVMDAIHKSLP